MYISASKTEQNTRILSIHFNIMEKPNISQNNYSHRWVLQRNVWFFNLCAFILKVLAFINEKNCSSLSIETFKTPNYLQHFKRYLKQSLFKLNVNPSFTFNSYPAICSKKKTNWLILNAHWHSHSQQSMHNLWEA